MLSLAASAGWQEMPPSVSQRRAPPTQRPMPGTNTNTKASKVSTKSQPQRRRRAAAGSLAATAMATAPAASHTACRRRKCAASWC